MQLQYSYTNEGGSGVNRTVIIVVVAVVAVLLIAFVLVAVLCVVSTLRIGLAIPKLRSTP